MTNQSAAVQRFRELHESGCFVLPNPWDVGSALYLEHLGFDALATTSAGFAFAQGYADGPKATSRAFMLEHFRQIATATKLPVNADFQNGYADSPQEVADSVKLCIETGVAGLSIEDSTGRAQAPLYDFELAVERIKAARSAIDNAQVPVVLTARCEAWLVGDSAPLETSLKRLPAFAAAGADCLYAPGVSKSDEISAIVQAVAPKPVNVLVSTNNCTTSVAELADLDVRRISVGAALSRVAWGAFIRAARQIKDEGRFDAFANAAPFDELMKVFAHRSES